MKACFTAVFPSLIRLQQTKPTLSTFEDHSPLSSGQSTPTGTRPSSADHLKPILDKLLSLVQALLLQELRQSTLDEIFTLLEPYLKLPEVLSREMAITILHATLKAFNEKRFAVEFYQQEDQEEPNHFAPGPYIIGSLVPRCFDTSRHVQSNALTCLQLLVSKTTKRIRQI